MQHSGIYNGMMTLPAAAAAAAGTWPHDHERISQLRPHVFAPPASTPANYGSCPLSYP